MFVVHGSKVTSSPLRMFASVVVAMLGLCHCSNHNGTFLRTPELSGPSEALGNTVAVFECKLLPHPENETVLMTLFNRGSTDTWLGDSTSLAGEAAIFNLVVKPSHAGDLVCQARAQNNSNIKPTFSNTHYLKVFEPVSSASVSIMSFTTIFEGEDLYLSCTADGNNVSFTWLQNDQPISSPHVMSRDHSFWIDRTTQADSGTYVCEASNGTDFTTRSQEFNITVKGPRRVFEGEKLVLFCPIDGINMSFTWLLNYQPISSPHVLFSDRLLWINRTTQADSGTYVCEASISLKGIDYVSRSWNVNVIVKAVVSDPDISFAVLTEDSHYFSVGVTCQSAVGTPPVAFSLYNGTESVANVTSADRRAVFRVPVVFGEHLGTFRCQANNGAKTASSGWLPIKIEKVKGPVSLTYDYDIAENFAVVGVRLYCKVAAGSHLRYQWFLNKSLLQDHGSFYYVFNQLPEQSILILSVGRSSAGTYHCVVSNSFDNTTTISSRGRYLDKEVLNRLPVLVVAVVFGCFIFLILLVVICCGFGVIYSKIYWRREYGDKFLLEMERRVVAYEGELDVSEYSDGADVLRTVGDGFDQASDASSDEWPQIARQKKTIEDEPIEVPLGFK
ncbi:platelet endothelial cell adhesion molecule-like isoform X3 [Solea solea]|uniref:platelet endothelial cell adhesion molecule-like isoform X3 n=1 Tax=Solea solea TaxID=90069 RepID=UPI00272D1BFD|nr:platelet endothelial cell adhesion molecule-like isoform X3 [Solea solea]